jgi:hypothetical protein
MLRHTHPNRATGPLVFNDTNSIPHQPRRALKCDEPEIFAADDPTGTLQAVWKVKEQLRALLRTGSLEDAAAAKAELEKLVKAAARPESNRLYRTVCRWWKEIEVLIITGATTNAPPAGTATQTTTNRLFS